MRIHRWISLLLLCSCHASVHGDSLQRLLDDAVRKNAGRGGGVLRIESGSRGLLWTGASGGLGDGTPIRTDDAFEIASITKTMTAVLVLQFVEEGKLALDERVEDALSADQVRHLLVVGGRSEGARVTIRELLNHTSGLPDYWEEAPKGDKNLFLKAFLADPHRLWAPEEVLALGPPLVPLRVRGKFHYGDTGYVLLGLALEHASGQRLQDLFRKRFFVPLHMTSTYLAYRELPPAGLREAHRYEDRLDLYGQRRQTAEWAGGGLISSAADLSRFIFALAHGRLFRSPTTLRTMQTWVSTETDDVAYGLGIFGITLDHESGHLWGHDGHGNVFMYYWPEQDLAIVGTLNQTENDWWPLVARAISTLCARPLSCRGPGSPVASPDR